MTAEVYTYKSEKLDNISCNFYFYREKQKNKHRNIWKLRRKNILLHPTKNKKIDKYIIH